MGRESARLLKALGFRIIAANTSGAPRKQDGYIPPGGGDAEGKIPEKYYSTEDESQVKDFLKQCDVLVASLPNTPKTRGFLTKERLGEYASPSCLLVQAAVLLQRRLDQQRRAVQHGH